MNRSDFALAVQDCLPARPTRHVPGTEIRPCDEYGSAEAIAAALFRAHFERRHAGQNLMFISQNEYLRTRDNSCAAIEFLLNMMKVHFRNWVSPRSPMREGGFRKPDGMGIAASGKRVVVELMEVKPSHSAMDGCRRMQDMLRRLRDGLSEFVKGQNQRDRFEEQDFSFSPTRWRPQADELVCPLLNPANTPELIWASFASMQGITGNEGVILYEVHSMEFADSDDMFRRIPGAVRQRITALCDDRGWKFEAGSSWQDAYCVSNPNDVKALKRLGPAGDWGGLVAALALLLSQSAKGQSRAASTAQYRTLLQSSRPLSFTAGGLTALEPAIYEGIVLADAIRRH